MSIWRRVAESGAFTLHLPAHWTKAVKMWNEENGNQWNNVNQWNEIKHLWLWPICLCKCVSFSLDLLSLSDTRPTFCDGRPVCLHSGSRRGWRPCLHSFSCCCSVSHSGETYKYCWKALCWLKKRLKWCILSMQCLFCVQYDWRNKLQCVIRLSHSALSSLSWRVCGSDCDTDRQYSEPDWEVLGWRKEEVSNWEKVMRKRNEKWSWKWRLCQKWPVMRSNERKSHSEMTMWKKWRNIKEK